MRVVELPVGAEADAPPPEYCEEAWARCCAPTEAETAREMPAWGAG